MFSFLKLIRLPNLIIIALTQALIRYGLIIPGYMKGYNQTGIFPEFLTKTGFCLLVLSTVLIAAAGYIINDVFDVRIDEINKPGKNRIGKKFSEKFARRIFYVFSITGILIGFYLALGIQKPVMGFVQVFSVVSLYMYASQFKKRLLIGNILIALLSSLAVLIVGLYEPSYYFNIKFILFYAGFAFIVSLIREIIKDMEDIDGDERAQCKSLPILYGIKRTKLIVIILILLTMAALTFIFWGLFSVSTVINFTNLILLSMLPFLALIYLVAKAGVKRDFHYASLFTKAIMIYGILSIVPLWYYILR